MWHYRNKRMVRKHESCQFHKQQHKVGVSAEHTADWHLIQNNLIKADKAIITKLQHNQFALELDNECAMYMSTESRILNFKYYFLSQILTIFLKSLNAFFFLASCLT